MKNGKGQMEIMGLVIVVILLVLGLLFVVTFIILKSGSDVQPQVKAGVLATSTGNSMLYATSACKGMSFQELLQDCAGEGAVVCGGVSSCSYVNESFADLLNKSLAVQDVKYYMVGKVGEDVIIGPIGVPCPGQQEPWYQPLSTSYGSVLTLTLNVCR